MAGLVAGFDKASEVVRHEHEAINSELSELEACLKALVCYSEVYADLSPVERLDRCGRHLQTTLPEHFRNEESTIFVDLETAFPRLQSFVQQMKRQHSDLQAGFDQFCHVLDEVDESNDVEQTICNLKQTGLDFTRAMMAHIATEESGLGGFAR